MSAAYDGPSGPAEANGHEHILAASDRLEILKLQAWWTAMVRAGRPERAAELCAEDVVVLPPDAPPISGREAARAWLKGLNGGAVERIEVAGVDLRGGPRSAWMTATVTTTRLAQDGVRSMERERRLWALIKDGPTWRVRLAGWEAAEEADGAQPEASEPVPVLGEPSARRASWRNPFRR
jgi:ketosteroid isomerase-like protein